MLDSVKKFKEEYPWAFWTLAVIVFPVGIALLVWFLLSRRGGNDRDLMDRAARLEGQTDIHEENAKSSESNANAHIDNAEDRAKAIEESLRQIRQASQEARREPATSWDALDKETGAKDAK